MAEQQPTQWRYPTVELPQGTRKRGEPGPSDGGTQHPLKSVLLLDEYLKGYNATGTE